MTDNKIKYNIEALLPRYCEGTATDEEICKVEEWMEENENNRKIVNQIHMINLATDTLHIMQSVDTEKALIKVKGRINVKKTSWWEWTQRIAAVLFFPLLIGALIMYMSKVEHESITQIIEVKTNPGMITSLKLPDGTVVCLNSESVLRYPSSFEGGLRNVELVGEAYFDVVKDEKKRFVISTPHQSQIEVFGTSFNVEAYETEGRVSATLVEGHIGFQYKDKDGAIRKIDLKPNSKLIYKSASQETEIRRTSCESEIAWKDGKIVFNDTSLEDILYMLSKRFNVEFVVKNRNLKEYSFTGTFTTQRLERIMEYFKISSRINWRYLDSDEITDKKQKIEIY